MKSKLYLLHLIYRHIIIISNILIIFNSFLTFQYTLSQFRNFFELFSSRFMMFPSERSKSVTFIYIFTAFHEYLRISI